MPGLSCDLSKTPLQTKNHLNGCVLESVPSAIYLGLLYQKTSNGPNTDLDINKLEFLQRRAARWVTCDYQYTFSVSTMLQDLNWRTRDQRRIDSRLVLLYKVTYDLVAIPASDYLMQNTHPFSRNHPMAYRQITALKYFYKYTFFPWTIIHWNALPHHIPTRPTLAQFSSAVCQVVNSTNSTFTA